MSLMTWLEGIRRRTLPPFQDALRAALFVAEHYNRYHQLCDGPEDSCV